MNNQKEIEKYWKTLVLFEYRVQPIENKVAYECMKGQHNDAAYFMVD